jgi:hypothetical protein
MAAGYGGHPNGTNVAEGAGMMPTTPLTREYSENSSFLRWIFVRRGRTVTCEIRANGDGSYDVCVVPHWDVGASTIESYQRPIDALERHAEISWYLHEDGWSRLSELPLMGHGTAA